MTKKVTIGADTWNAPTDWADCSADQLHELLPLQLVDLEDQEPEAAGRMKALALKVLLPGIEKYVNEFSDDHWYQLGRLTKFIWTTRITQKPFDSFTLSDAAGKPVTYLLPDDNFTNTTAIEVSMANIHYLSFTRPKQPNQMAVLALIATLCRPQRADLKKFRNSKDWNGDRREPYNTIKADERAPGFAKLPLATIMAITQYFEAMNGRFLKLYKDVYEPDPAADEEAPMYENGEGLVTTLMDIAKTGVFGDFGNVCMQNSHTVWLYLRDNNKKIKRANARTEKDN
jgi:hypothetical protein